MARVQKVGVVEAEGLLLEENVVRTPETVLEMSVYATSLGTVDLVADPMTLTPEGARDLARILHQAADVAMRMRVEQGTG